jgi:hypothetical protein
MTNDISVLARLPDVENAKDTGLLVESGGVEDETLDRTVPDLHLHEVVVVGRSVSDFVLLQVDGRDWLLLGQDKGPYERARRQAVSIR